LCRQRTWGTVSPPCVGVDIAASLIVGLLFFAGQLGLEGDPEPPLAVESPDQSVESHQPVDEPMRLPVPGVIGLMGMAAALAVLQRRDDLSPAAGLALESDPLVVFVPGHGQPQGSSAFADLIEYMDIEPDDVRHFDYRFVDGGADASQASEDVGIDAAATGLNAYLGGVAGDGRQIYLVGFSKGGATIAELVADWDAGRWGPSDSVVGAALLDPPISAGAQGWLQSVGRHWGPVPDDGGYDPVQCTFLGFGCSDRRAGLGERSDVEVVVVRNPKAGVTSFGDRPPGLRIYEAADDGPTVFGQLARNPLRIPSRIAQAHDAVLHDRRVAACIVSEIGSGRCDLVERSAPRSLPSLRRSAVRPPSAQKVL
jgi:hypothetical protein